MEVVENDVYNTLDDLYIKPDIEFESTGITK